MAPLTGQYTWTESAEALQLTVPLKGASPSTVDVFGESARNRASLRLDPANAVALVCPDAQRDTLLGQLSCLFMTQGADASIAMRSQQPRTTISEQREPAS